jgi:hypothetical protein
MFSRFLRALAVAFRPRFELLQDTMTLADGRARILLRAEGIGILFAGDFVAVVNGRYAATLLIPTGRRVRFVFVTALGPFVKRVSVAAALHVARGAAASGGERAWLDRWSGTRVQWRAAAPQALLERLRVRTRGLHGELDVVDRARLMAGAPPDRRRDG